MQGQVFARKAGVTMKKYLEDNKIEKYRIFSSRLLRCVQTAHEISNILHTEKSEKVPPIYLSCGLSTLAAAVHKTMRKKKSRYLYAPFYFVLSYLNSTQDYDFCSTKELQEICPGSNFENFDEPSSILPFRLAVEAILNDGSKTPNVFNIIVAHRETIRYFQPGKGRSIRPPYCCLTFFQFRNKKEDEEVQDYDLEYGEEDQSVLRFVFSIQDMISMDGKLIKT